MLGSHIPIFTEPKENVPLDLLKSVIHLILFYPGLSCPFWEATLSPLFDFFALR